ncbi:menaquinone biosynthetic enzyme MqnA/MqnD family protein [Silvibacterium acidisoli]|uniref:menaquinone biosynthetic enzyme MqnA/MqnD family protein n=1 Tax=Acidobacteriaceae bacterium ZG23-2 TaxID=2883246 RepID=UPI00406D0F9B
MSHFQNKFILAAIDFINPAPLMWDFEHEPRRSELLQRYEIHFSTPAECARRVAEGSADVGLIPAAGYERIGGAKIIPGCTVASLGHIRSILLVTRAGADLSGIRKVALDTSSLTSATYTRILFRKLWKADPEFVNHAPQLDLMLQNADAALLIGDPALLALEDREEREERTGEKLDYLDLGEEWVRWAGVPWVSAFWAVRGEAFHSGTVSPVELVEDFQRSRDHGLAHIEDLVREWAVRVPVPADTLRTYLSSNIHYVLDQPCLEGLGMFYRYAAECGALTNIPELKFL